MLICIFSLAHFLQLVWDYTVSAMSDLPQSQHKLCFSAQRAVTCFWTRSPRCVAKPGRPYRPRSRPFHCFLWNCNKHNFLVRNFSNSQGDLGPVHFLGSLCVCHVRVCEYVTCFPLINNFDSHWAFVYHVVLPSLDSLRLKTNGMHIQSIICFSIFPIIIALILF